MLRAVFAVTVCLTASAVCLAADSTATPAADSGATDSVRVFTVKELATFDGRDGRPAYIAVDGVVYDVSNARGWKKGKHEGNTAGKDVTAAIKKSSPHGTKVLKKNPVVGALAIEPEKK